MCRIMDMTERFPEGLDGVDMLNPYNDYDAYVVSAYSEEYGVYFKVAEISTKHNIVLDEENGAVYINQEAGTKRTLKGKKLKEFIRLLAEVYTRNGKSLRIVNCLHGVPFRSAKERDKQRALERLIIVSGKFVVDYDEDEYDEDYLPF